MPFCVRASLVRPLRILLLAAAMLPSELASAGVDPTGSEVPIWTVPVGIGTEVVEIVLSPDGSTVYAAGSLRTNRQAAMLSAYDTSTGDLRWQFTSSRSSLGGGVAISPSGDRVVLVGNVAVPGRSARAMGTWTFRTSNGKSLWFARHFGDGATRDAEANDVAFAPAGSRVFVAGLAWYKGHRRDAVVIAYDAARGSRQWIRVSDSGRTGGSSSGMSDFANALTVSPDGATVVATGMAQSDPNAFGGSLLTFAMSSGTGRLRWMRRIRIPSNRDDIEHAGVDLDVLGGSIVVAGSSRYLDDDAPAYRSLVVRLRLGDGRTQWQERFRTEPEGVTLGKSMEARSDGVFVGGWNSTASAGAQFRIWSHAPSDGAVRWASPSLGGGEVTQVALGADTELVYAGGWLNPEGGTSNLTVAAYEPATGALVWTAGTDEGHAGQEIRLAVTDDGSTLVAASASSDGAVLLAFNPT